MGLLAFVILTLITGLIVGALARLALPGPDPMTLGQTAMIGIAGSLIAGVAVFELSGHRAAAGLPVSILVTIGLVYLVRRSRGGSLTQPGAGGRLRRR